MKPVFKKSKKTIVCQWLAKNRALIGVSNNDYACDMRVEYLGENTFSFIWNKSKGTIKCDQRVLPSTLSLTN